jgi:hypothetical protein
MFSSKVSRYSCQFFFDSITRHNQSGRAFLQNAGDSRNIVHFNGVLFEGDLYFLILSFDRALQRDAELLVRLSQNAIFDFPSPGITQTEQQYCPAPVTRL